MLGSDPVAGTSPVRGQSSVEQRNPAAAMSRRARSSVGNRYGASFPKPLQGRDRVWSPRIARICTDMFADVLRGTFIMPMLKN